MIRRRACLVIAGTTAMAPLFTQTAAREVTGPQVVDAIEGVFGVHAGKRRNHAKGSCAAGEFVGTAEGARYSRSQLFSGDAVPVIARFSLGGGNPEASDAEKSVRGMALQFQLPQGQLHQMAMLNTPVFGAARPETFYDLMLALRPDPATGKADPGKLEAFRASHPDSLAQMQFLATHNPPASYADSVYWGLHAFRFVDRDGEVTPVRWRFVPQGGEKLLSDEALKTAGTDFLEKALISRTAKTPARWDMRVTIGQPSDPLDDPTQAWPTDRYEFEAGTLTITSASAQAGAACEPINFDPMVMADGIEPTDDPVLRFRSPAYAASFVRRLQGR